MPGTSFRELRAPRWHRRCWQDDRCISSQASRKGEEDEFDDIKAITNEDIKLHIDTKQDLVENDQGENNQTEIQNSVMINSRRGLGMKSPTNLHKAEEEVFDNLKGLDITYSS